MLIRQSAPVLGASINPYQQPGEWQVSLGFRTLTSDTHFRRAHEEVPRRQLGTYVVNRQNMADLNATYAFTPRLSASVSVPFVAASWSIPTPTSPVPGPRAQQDARGLGDIGVVGRAWLFDPRCRLGGNLAIGLGVKAPTGEYAAMDTYPDRTGQNNQPRYVDQSVQPGDGGWGIVVEVQGFQRRGRFTFFGSGTYLINPRNTNGTPSLVVARGGSIVITPANANRLVNSVPDQYVARVGVATRLKRQLAGSVAWRVEGLPRYDLIGRSDGFRRPGISFYVEPGVSWGSGRQQMSFSVPIAFYRNRMPDPYTGVEGDATFPRFIFLAGYGLRLGKPVAPP